MKKLDYIFIACFGAVAMMLTNELINKTIISVGVGVIAIIYCFIAVKEDSRGE